jgi:hypothetical protein
MLEKIVLENLIVKEHTEYTFTKEGYVLDQNCTWDEWYDFSDFIKKLYNAFCVFEMTRTREGYEYPIMEADLQSRI